MTLLGTLRTDNIVSKLLMAIIKKKKFELNEKLLKEAM